MRDYSLLCRMIVSITIAFFRCIVNSKMWCSVWEDVVRAQICAIQSLYMFITIIPTVSPNNQTVFVLLTVTMDYQRMLPCSEAEEHYLVYYLPIFCLY